jgi:hypothetical protein
VELVKNLEEERVEKERKIKEEKDIEEITKNEEGRQEKKILINLQSNPCSNKIRLVNLLLTM